MEIFNESLTTLERAMDLRMVNQRVIAANLANVDTPGYQARQLNFATSLTNALNDAAAPPVIEPSTGPARSFDGNNVDLEGELGHMSQNKVMYSVSAQIMSSKLRQLSTMLDQERTS